MAPAAQKPSKPKASASAPPKPTTTIDERVDRPSVTAPGDGAADTTDPAERVSSARPDFGAAARAGHGTVNAVVPVKPRPAAVDQTEHRVERYDARRPDGTWVEMEHDIDTGTTKIVGPGTEDHPREGDARR